MKKYDIGIDIGTSSIGWAVINSTTNKVIKKFNKRLWGVLLFDEAQTAEDRRLFRATRRRYDRRRKRIKLLRQEFQEEINKQDSSFYQKMNEFYLYKEDKSKYLEDDNFFRNYSKKYPTIFHLRKELIDNPLKKDIRLVYLAIHHIIKYRGNFLYENENFKIENLDMDSKMEKILDLFLELRPELIINRPNESLTEIISNRDECEIRLKKYFKYIFGNNGNDWANLILGKKGDIFKIFDVENESNIKKISFKDDDYDEILENLAKIIGDRIEILEEIKELYNMKVLKGILSEGKYISDVMVKNYEKHKADLKLLKKVLAKVDDKYRREILNGKDCLYEKYIKNRILDIEFLGKLKKIISQIDDDSDELKQIKELLDNNNFMPKITSKENSELPYQIHNIELVKIIENQGKYYPFLLQKTENGNYRIQEILKFRIPYYVGPLNDTTMDKNKKNPNAWACRKNNETITPFNFDEVINKDASAAKFIERMISHCTYLLEEKVLPANSILYSKFKVWNELKQIKVNGERISHKLQQNIMKDLFEIKGKISGKDLEAYLKQTGECDMYDTLEITGYSADNKFANNMQSYVDFFGDNGIFKNKNYSLEDAEQIIQWITVFEDKKILERKIKEIYPELSDKLSQIKSKKYSGWGNLSKKFLTEVYFENDCGEFKSIMDLMEETKDNFMQIYNSSKYGFQKKVNEINSQKTSNYINYSLVENLATSPANKKGIYQALKIIDEIIHLMGYYPQNISIEMARGEGKKGRIPERKKQLENIYKKYTAEIENFSDYSRLYSELEHSEKLDSEKIYLYFIQEGKSLYTGEPIRIDELEKYEVDHIIPQSLIKDNSWDNKALVEKRKNQEKADNLVLPKEYRNYKNKAWWKHLQKIGLISQKKFYNLCREEFREEDINGFIERQLVETRQICKHVANIIETVYKDVNVIYLHADLSSNYREKFELFKFREINDFHHAHDAYLAAVLGNYQKSHLKRLTSTLELRDMKKYIPDEDERKKRLKFGYVVNSLDPVFQLYDTETGELLFDINTFNQTIADTLYQNDIIINRKTEIKTGKFFKDTKKTKKDKVSNPILLKQNLNPDKYGKYSSIKYAYVLLVKYFQKNKEKQKLIGVPIMYAESNNNKAFTKYLRNILKLSDTDTFKIVPKIIPFNTLINWDGKLGYITGASIELQNATELKIEKDMMKKWKYTLNRLLNGRIKEGLDDLVYGEQLTEIFDYLINKIEKYYKIYNSELKIILEKFKISDEFYLLSLEEKELFLKQIFLMLSCNGKNANLKSFGLKDGFGRVSKESIEHGKIITKSITGIKERYYEF